MKKLLYIPAILLLAACSQPKGKDAKIAELAKLKSQQADLNSQIAKLQAEVGTQDSVKSTLVNVQEIKPGNFTNYVQLQGRIDAQDNVVAYPQASGSITALHVKAGDRVSKGQVLAQLDNSVLLQNIGQAQAQANLAQTVYQRQKNLWDQKIGTEVQYLQAKSNFESAEKQVASLKQQSDLYRIVSPISGSVDQMDLKLGQIASPGATGIRIVNADVLKIKADVPESYASSVRLGDNVKVVVPDANDSLMAKVTFAAKVIDQASRSFGIEIKLPLRKTLRPNMTAVIKVANYTNKGAIVIPLNSVQRSETGNYVFVNQNGTAKKKNVKLGVTYGGQIEILSGLTNGDQLITAGGSEVQDGDKIKVSQSSAN
ncbi:efflux RND transporter periplasmic adaptor subunit [Mucilaginibacter sp. McL0603]|uniref:efflux RND transporter periplasmic adaptor subunit n=1 Tax=Mucilaginibacter sp. McL0603 TaxID=3415670 RepID=UPI003CE6FD1F